MNRNGLSLQLRALMFSLFLAPVAASAESGVATPRDRTFLTYHHFNSLAEVVHMQIGVLGPGRSIPGDTVIEHELTVIDASGGIVGALGIEVPIRGFAEVTFETAPDTAAGYGSVNILANGRQLGELQPDARFDRISFAVAVSPSVTGRNPQTGETTPISARATPIVSTTTIEKLNGTTRATAHTQYESKNLEDLSH